MFLSEIIRLRGFTWHVIFSSGFEDTDLLDELCDTDNDHLQEFTVYVLGLLNKEQIDSVCKSWQDSGKELPDLYFGGEE